MTQPSPEIDPAKAVTVGRVLAPHGVRGELKVEPLTDFPERFKRGARLWLRGSPHRVEWSRTQGNLVYLKLEGVDTRTQAEGLRGEELRVPEAFALQGEDVYYQHDIVGLRVEDEGGEPLGRVESIFSTGANDVYIVRGEKGELLLPAVEDVVKAVDVPGRRIVVRLLPGLDFSKPLAGPTTPRSRRKRRAAGT